METLLKLVYYDTPTETLSESKNCLFRVGSTMGDLFEAAEKLFGVSSETATFVKISQYHIETYYGAPVTPIRQMRPVIYNSGQEIVVRDQAHDVVGITASDVKR